MTITTVPRQAPHVVRAGEGERIWIAGDTMRIIATSAETGGALTVLEVDVASGGGPPLHLHENEDEALCVLDGEFEFLIGAERARAAAGAVAVVPRGTPHRWRNTGGGAGRMLIAFTPGGLEGFFREAGRPAADDGPAPPVDADEISRTEVAGRRYGLRVVEWAP